MPLIGTIAHYHEGMRENLGKIWASSHDLTGGWPLAYDSTVSLVYGHHWATGQ